MSEAGGFGVVQPIALTRLYGHDYREGLRMIKSLTDKPFGVNITILPNTAAAAKYRGMNEEFLEVALEEGVKFILTSLGKPNDIVKRCHEAGVKVYHDVHTPKIALQAAAAGVDGLNLLNSSMGGQTGAHTPEDIISCAAQINLERGFDGDFPFLCAGGVANGKDLTDRLNLGECGVTDERANCAFSGVWRSPLAKSVAWKDLLKRPARNDRLKQPARTTASNDRLESP